MLRPNGLQVLPGETTNPKIEQIEVRNVEALLLSQEGNRTQGRGATCPPETMATFSFDYCWVFNHHEHPSTKEISLLRLHFFLHSHALPSVFIPPGKRWREECRQRSELNTSATKWLARSHITQTTMAVFVPTWDIPIHPP